MRRTRLRPGDWLYRTERRIDHDGTERVDRYRRRVLEVRGEQLRLSGVERETADGWQPHGGLLGMATTTTAERLASTGYAPAR